MRKVMTIFTILAMSICVFALLSKCSFAATQNSAIQNQKTDDAIEYYKRGLVLYNEDSFNEALSNFIKAEEIGGLSKENEVLLYEMMGECYYVKKDTKNALLYFDKEIKLEPGIGYTNKALIFYEAENYNEALKNYKLAEKYGVPDELEFKLYFAISQCYSKLNDKENALKYFNKSKYLYEHKE